MVKNIKPRDLTYICTQQLGTSTPNISVVRLHCPLPYIHAKLTSVTPTPPGLLRPSWLSPRGQRLPAGGSGCSPLGLFGTKRTVESVRTLL